MTGKLTKPYQPDCLCRLNKRVNFFHMPQRTNLFQQTVKAIETALNGRAKVEESVMMTNSVGFEYEIDVLITHEV